jgi:excisionase family DNA binding protein
MTARQAAKYLGYSLSRLYKLANEKKIKSYKPVAGGKNAKIFFCKQDLNEFIFGK